MYSDPEEIFWRCRWETSFLAGRHLLHVKHRGKPPSNCPWFRGVSACGAGETTRRSRAEIKREADFISKGNKPTDKHRDMEASTPGTPQAQRERRSGLPPAASGYGEVVPRGGTLMLEFAQPPAEVSKAKARRRLL